MVVLVVVVVVLLVVAFICSSCIAFWLVLCINHLALLALQSQAIRNWHKSTLTSGKKTLTVEKMQFWKQATKQTKKSANMPYLSKHLFTNCLDFPNQTSKHPTFTAGTWWGNPSTQLFTRQLSPSIFRSWMPPSFPIRDPLLSCIGFWFLRAWTCWNLKKMWCRCFFFWILTFCTDSIGVC